MILSHEQRLLIGTLSDGGLSPKEIALLTGILLRQVQYHAKLHVRESQGYRSRVELLERSKEIVRLYMEGQTMAEIGAKYKITRERVRQLLHKEGVVGRKKWKITNHVKAPKFKPTRIDTFWSLVDKTPGFGPNGDCWKWTGTVYGGDWPKSPSGRFCFRGRMMPARRMMILVTERRLSDTEMIASSCNEALCVNPAHFIEGSFVELVASRSPIYQLAGGKKKKNEQVAPIPGDQTPPVS